MARKKHAKKHTRLPDGRYGDHDISYLINVIMLNGKKTVAERIAYGALETVAQEKKSTPVEILQDAIKAVMPLVEVKSRRVGGATYPVPIEVRPERSKSLAMRWIVQSAKAKTGTNMLECLTDEIRLACEGKGSAVKKREDTHRMAEANRAFSHYRW